VNQLVDGSVEQRERQMAATKGPMMAEVMVGPSVQLLTAQLVAKSVAQ
jgi:hypothetical protein